MPEWTIHLLHLIPFFGFLILIIGIKEVKKTKRKIKAWVQLTAKITDLMEVTGSVGSSNHSGSNAPVNSK